MLRLLSRHILLLLINYVFFAGNAYCQNQIDSSRVTIGLRIGGGPAIIAVDPGYYFQNELTIDFSKRFSIISSYGIGSAFSGIRDLRIWFLPEADPSEEEYTRQQSVLTINAGMQISLINREKHRIYVGFGPGLNFYNYSEGSMQPYGDIKVYRISNKSTQRLALNYFAGYEYKAGKHLKFGLGFYGSQFTEYLYSIQFNAGYRF